MLAGSTVEHNRRAPVKVDHMSQEREEWRISLRLVDDHGWVVGEKPSGSAVRCSIPRPLESRQRHFGSSPRTSVVFHGGADDRHDQYP